VALRRPCLTIPDRGHGRQAAGHGVSVPEFGQPEGRQSLLPQRLTDRIAQGGADQPFGVGGGSSGANSSPIDWKIEVAELALFPCASYAAGRKVMTTAMAIPCEGRYAIVSL
jgi:hypothetical protein